MVSSGWVSSLSQNFTDKTDIWRDICVVSIQYSPGQSNSSNLSVFQVQTVFYLLTVVTLLATDTQILDL